MVEETVILQLICPDRPGLVSELSGWIAKNNGNIRHADHHTDNEANLFLSRIEWDFHGFLLDKHTINIEIKTLADKLHGKAVVTFSDEVPRVAILVSKQSHCLVDLLWRVKSGELNMEVPLVISNHRLLEDVCKRFSVPFKFVPVNKANKLTAEKEILTLFTKYDIHLAILAKYCKKRPRY